jgi:hypothetical protein
LKGCWQPTAQQKLDQEKLCQQFHTIEQGMDETDVSSIDKGARFGNKKKKKHGYLVTGIVSDMMNSCEN